MGMKGGGIYIFLTIKFKKYNLKKVFNGKLKILLFIFLPSPGKKLILLYCYCSSPSPIATSTGFCSL